MDDQIATNIFAVISTMVVLIFLYVILWKRREVALFILEALTVIIFAVALVATSFVMYLILNSLLIMSAGQQYFFFPNEWYVLLVAALAGGLTGCIEKVKFVIGVCIAIAASFIVIFFLVPISGFSISSQILPSVIWVSLIAGGGAFALMRPFTLAYAQTLTDNNSSREGSQGE